MLYIVAQLVGPTGFEPPSLDRRQFLLTKTRALEAGIVEGIASAIYHLFTLALRFL
jgi:hypothetical protein